MFKPEFRRRTLLNSAYVLISIIGLVGRHSLRSERRSTEIAGRQHMSAGLAPNWPLTRL